MKAPSPYAIVRVGGKQYKVPRATRSLSIAWPPRRATHIDSSPRWCATRAADAAGKAAAKVKAKVVEHTLGGKVDVFTYKPKSTFKKMHGHRSRLPRLDIDDRHRA